MAWLMLYELAAQVWPDQKCLFTLRSGDPFQRICCPLMILFSMIFLPEDKREVKFFIDTAKAGALPRRDNSLDKPIPQVPFIQELFCVPNEGSDICSSLLRVRAP